MGRMPWATYLWPGLPQICRFGSWPGLGLAIAFAVLLNLALAGTILWGGLFTPGARKLIWMAVAITWLGSAAVAWFRKDPIPRDPNADPYPQALEHYLKGNWFEAEQILTRLLDHNPRDLEARLMFATLLAHTGRPQEAARQLDWLEGLEGSGKWALEIARQRRLLAEQPPDQHPSPPPDGNPPTPPTPATTACGPAPGHATPA